MYPSYNQYTESLSLSSFPRLHPPPPRQSRSLSSVEVQDKPYRKKARDFPGQPSQSRLTLTQWEHHQQQSSTRFPPQTCRRPHDRPEPSNDTEVVLRKNLMIGRARVQLRWGVGKARVVASTTTTGPRGLATSGQKKHEIWRDENEQDNLPKVRRRDGTIAEIHNVRGFVDYERHPDPYRDPMERVFDWGEINETEGHDPVERTIQAARCMDCGTPFCQTHTGCPINNLIPEFNSLVYQDQWKQALDRLSQTNNFPEFTGRVCPAPCEGACVAGLVDSPVTIKNIEYSIVERGFDEGWITPRVPKSRTGMSVAVVGSGPAGLAAADCLNQQGHKVTVYEREDQIGGLLMYGIPNMKLDKDKVQRRVDLLAEEGIEFVTNAHIGVNVDVNVLRANNDALVLAVGATMPRDLPVPGREGKGIHFAMEFLTKNQKRLLMSRDGTLASAWDSSTFVTAEGRDVVVIGGGDTGTDCIGTSMRHRCKSILNFELMGQPPQTRASTNPWPEWPKVFGVDYGHAEVRAVFGKDPRQYGVITTEFVLDSDQNVKAVRTSDAKLGPKGVEILPSTEREWPADLVVLAMGFVSPEHTIAEQLNLSLDQRNNLHAEYGDYHTSVEGVFAAGDCRRGQSLVVWAIHEGREAAQKCDLYLQKRANADWGTPGRLIRAA